MRNQLSKLASIIILPQAIIHQLSVNSASSTSIIISVQIDFIASKSTQTIVLYLFYVERLFTNMFLIHFQTRDRIRVRMRSRVHHAMVPSFRARFFYNIFLYSLTNYSSVAIAFFNWQVFFKRVKETNETTNPISGVILINRLTHHCNLSLLASILLFRISPANEHNYLLEHAPFILHQ